MGAEANEVSMNNGFSGRHTLGRRREMYNCKRAFRAVLTTWHTFKHHRRPQLNRTELKPGELHTHTHRLKQACPERRLTTVCTINLPLISGGLDVHQPKRGGGYKTKQHRPNL